MSSDLEIKFPAVRYERDHQHYYSDLVNGDVFPFYGYNRTDVFIFAMSYTHHKGITPKVLSGNTLDLPARGFNTHHRTLMRSLAISVEDKVSIIKDNNMVTHICEQYANASIVEIFTKLKNIDPTNTTENILKSFIINS